MDLSKSINFSLFREARFMIESGVDITAFIYFMSKLQVLPFISIQHIQQRRLVSEWQTFRMKHIRRIDLESSATANLGLFFSFRVGG